MCANYDAVGPNNGFTYQRLYALYEILSRFDKNDIDEIGEEVDEDICIKKITGKKELIQTKFYKDKVESLAIDSGLLKVICRNIEKNDEIELIRYIVKSDRGFNKRIKEILQEESSNSSDLEQLGKYCVILKYNEHLNDKTKHKKINIPKIKNAGITYDKHKQYIHKCKCDNCNKHNKKECKYNKCNKCNNDVIFHFLLNKNFCSKYFKKFKLEKGFTYDEINNKTNKLIEEKYADFLKGEEDLKQFKILHIWATIFHSLIDKLFNCNPKKKDERMLKITKLMKDLNDSLKPCNDPSILIGEALDKSKKSLEINIENTFLIDKIDEVYKQYTANGKKNRNVEKKFFIFWVDILNVLVKNGKNSKKIRENIFNYIMQYKYDTHKTLSFDEAKKLVDPLRHMLDNKWSINEKDIFYGLVGISKSKPENKKKHDHKKIKRI